MNISKDYIWNNKNFSLYCNYKKIFAGYWCKKCGMPANPHKSNGYGRNKCVDAETCIYTCNAGFCGAECGSDDECPDKCVGNKVFEGECEDNCKCDYTLKEDCTVNGEVCSEGACAITCVDNDGDGYGYPGGDPTCAHLEEDCDDNNADINPGEVDICNGINDDCAATLDGSGEVAPDNTLQDGVCALSKQSCISGIWQDDYSSVAGYEFTETTCDGAADNDCNGLKDCEDSNCAGRTCGCGGYRLVFVIF